MPQSLAPIPLGVEVVDQNRTLTVFMRERWQQLIDSFTLTPTAAAVSESAQAASIATTAAFTTRGAGYYRISYYMRKTAADGVSSSLTVTLGWTESAVPLTQAFAALTVDTTAAQQNGSITVYADASSDLTFAVAYVSGTPGQMAYRIEVRVEQLA